MAPGAIDIVAEITELTTKSFDKDLKQPAVTVTELELGDAVQAVQWTEPVVFGGGEDQWLFDPVSRRFDLSRGAQQKLIIDADDGVKDHRGVMLDPQKAVLVIVDMQNYFIHPECCHHPQGLAAVEPTLKVIARCRQLGIQVVFLNWGIDEHDLSVMPPAVQRAFCREQAASRGYGWRVNLGTELPNGQGRCCWKGSWNADIYKPLKAVTTMDDLYFDKARMSGLWSKKQAFHRYLRNSGKKTLLFAGVNTDQCLLGTLTDACSWGWDCILLKDCAGTMTNVPGAAAVCEHNITSNMGFVTDSHDFLNGKLV